MKKCLGITPVTPLRGLSQSRLRKNTTAWGMKCLSCVAVNHSLVLRPSMKIVAYRGTISYPYSRQKNVFGRVRFLDHMIANISPHMPEEERIILTGDGLLALFIHF